MTQPLDFTIAVDPLNPPPSRAELPDPHKAKLTDDVADALRALPIYYASTTAIEGLESGDLFSLNSVLGGSIENQVVATLNRIRKVWDPDDRWTEYGFERSSQTFPDVRLVSRSGGRLSVAMGIELKGWYLLSREKEPSFRYTVTPEACSPYDLLVVVPWHLTNVLSGVPRVYEPYVEQARYAAEFRNHYWQHQRGVAAPDNGITSPGGAQPYPPPKAKVSDKADKDSGGNFGRVARVHGLMEDYSERMLQTKVSGIEAGHWVSFFKVYADNHERDAIDARIDRLVGRQGPAVFPRVRELVKELGRLLGD